MINNARNLLNFSSEQLDDLSRLLFNGLTSEQKPENDVMVRRLFLHFVDAHQQFSTRFLYTFPAEEHHKIITKLLDQQISKTQKDILLKANKIRAEFLKDIDAYQLARFPTKDQMKIIWLALLLMFIVMRTLFTYIVPEYENYIKPELIFLNTMKEIFVTNNPSPAAIYILGILILLTPIPSTVFLYKSGLYLKNYEETRRWNNFVIGDLPSEFTNFLNVNLENAINAMTYISPENPKIITNSKINKQLRMEHFNNQQILEAHNNNAIIQTSFHQLPLKKKEKNIAAHELPEISELSIPNKSPPLSWKINGESPSEKQKIVRLWNNNKPYLRDVALYDEKFIEKKIIDTFTLKRFKQIADDGHRARAREAQGYIKESSESYKLKVLGILGDKRQLFKKNENISVVDGDNNTYDVYELTDIKFPKSAHKK